MNTFSPSRRGSGSAVPDLQRVVLLPGAAITLLATATVSWLVAAEPGGTLRAVVLAAVLVLALGTLVAAAMSATTAQRRFARSATELERAAADVTNTVSYGDEQLRRALEDLRQGRTPLAPAAPAENRSTTGPFGQLLSQLEYSQLTAYAAVTEAASLPAPNAASTQQVTVLVNLARRLQSLVHQGIKILDELEQQVEDPDLLRGLFEVDHIATRIRRYVENVAVLGGEVTRRQWRKPVPLASVVRSAIGEVERYSRVKPVPPIDGRLDGGAVADVVHLLAELIENATAFSPPGTQVHVRTQRVTTGYVVEIEDRGLGQLPEDERMRNALLADPDRVELGALLKDGRVGLYVVAVLARQHQIRVELRRNLFGGVTSLVLLPNPLLRAEDDEGDEEEGQGHARTAEPSGLETRQPASLSASAPSAAQPRARSAAPSAAQDGQHTGSYAGAQQAGTYPVPQGGTQDGIRTGTQSGSQAGPQPDAYAAPYPAQYDQPYDQSHQSYGGQTYDHQQYDRSYDRQPDPQWATPSYTGHTPAHTPTTEVDPVQTHGQNIATRSEGQGAGRVLQAAPAAMPVRQPQTQTQPGMPQRTQQSAGPRHAQPSAPMRQTSLPAAPAPTPVRDDGRPALPQRTQQTHMAPQLQRQPQSQQQSGYGTDDGADYTPANPGLMATYRRGVRAAEEQSGPIGE